MERRLEALAKELEAPSLRYVGKEIVWDPLRGEWVSVPVYELESGCSQELVSQGDRCRVRMERPSCRSPSKFKQYFEPNENSFNLSKKSKILLKQVLQAKVQ